MRINLVSGQMNYGECKMSNPVSKTTDPSPVRECCSQCNPFFDMQCHVEGCEYYVPHPKSQTAEHIERAASLWAGDSVEAYDDFMARWRGVPAMVRLVEMPDDWQAKIFKAARA